VSAVADAISWVCLVAGGIFCILGGVGLVRMPTFFTRIHAASLVDTLGAGLILLGLIVQAGFTLVSLKLAVIGVLLLFASPAATHALAKAAVSRGIDPLATGDRSSKP
jgi:multicomponent Na+:H+ antiporter subunit G